MAYQNHLTHNYKFPWTPQFSSQIPQRLQHYSDICIKTKSKNHSFQVNQRVVRNARGILDFFGTNVMSIPNRKRRKYNNFIPVDQTVIIKATFQIVLLIEHLPITKTFVQNCRGPRRICVYLNRNKLKSQAPSLYKSTINKMGILQALLSSFIWRSWFPHSILWPVTSGEK